MNRLSKLGFLAALALAACSPQTSPDSSSVDSDNTQFQALTGEAAHRFTLPADLLLVASHDTRDGRTYERYQQMHGTAKVLGGQVTLHRDRSTGNPKLVLGSHYDTIVPSNRIVLNADDVEVLVSEELQQAAVVTSDLMINAISGQYYYAVESHGDALRYIHWIDAETGAIINEYDGLTSGCDWNNGAPGGLDFKQQQVDLTGMVAGDDASGYTLDSGRQITKDLGSQKKPFFGTADADADGCYDTVNRESPGQGALVSAHVNVAKADTYYQGRGFDLAAEMGATQLTVWAHKDVNYVNAYWDGSKMVFGDGNGTSFSELVSLDIAAHEITHGVTEFTSSLIYQNESGALNESFSDIMGAVLEFQDEGANGDWLMGEDVMANNAGLRNMADPTTHGDPGHYCDRLTGTADNGGVHSNSGISNRAFYLLVADPAFGIGLDAATDIFYNGFTGLTENATFLAARTATEGAAPAEYVANVSAAWETVGVGADVVCDTAPDCSTDSVCNPDCAAGVDADCAVAPDCSTDGVCNPDCAAGADADCEPNTCDLGQPGDSCTSGSDCCSNNCKGKAGSKTCK